MTVHGEPDTPNPDPDRAPRRVRYPDVLFPRDVADLLGFPSERAALDWMRNERVPYVLVAGRARVLYDVLLDHLRERSRAAGEDAGGEALRHAVDRVRRGGDVATGRAVARLRGS
jgi:hypothetical protein